MKKESVKKQFNFLDYLYSDDLAFLRLMGIAINI